jgi:hypothetical protein
MESLNGGWSKSEKVNVGLVRAMCGGDSGDLTESHWLGPMQEIGGGTAGPRLKERGFINLLDGAYGVADQYQSDLKAPEGAVLVYQCGPGCLGDVAIKTKTGFLRDFFTSASIQNSKKRNYQLVGVYIKPEV